MTARTSATPRLSRLRVTVALLCFLGITIYLARPHFLEYFARQQQLADWQLQAEFERRLDAIIEMKFERKPTLQEWLAEWSRQAGVPCNIAEGQPAKLSQQRITLELKPTPARDAIQTLARLYHFGWSSEGGRVEVFPSGVVDDPLLVRTYPLPPAWNDAESYLEASRRLAPLLDALNVHEGALVCVERQPVQLQIQTFLRRLNVALEHAERLPIDSAAIDQDAWRPILLDDDPQALERALTVLKRRVDIDVQDVTLPEFARILSRTFDYPVIVDPDALEDFLRKFGGAKVACHLKQATLSEILRAASGRLGLRAEPVASGRVIAIHGRMRGPPHNQAICYAYPVADLLQGQDNRDHEQLLLALHQLVDDGDFYDTHGQPRSGSGGCGPLLIATQKLAAHQQLQALLATMRQARSGIPGTFARSQRGPQESEANVTALRQSAALRYRDMPLREVAADLKARFGLTLLIEPQDETVAATKVWCHLPERPLRENLDHLLNAYSLTTITSPQGNLHIIDSIEANQADHARPFEFEVHHLQSFLNPRSPAGLWVEALLNSDDDFNSRTGGGRGRFVRVGNLLVLAHQPAELDRVRITLTALRKQIVRSPAEVREAALRNQSQPLLTQERELALEEHAAWNAELHGRLAARDSLVADKTPLLPLLWELAEKHGLPIVHPGAPWADVDPLGEVTLSLQDQPVREILQQLLSEGNTKQWMVRDGLVQTWEPPFGQANYYVEWLFDIGDLLPPHGDILPGQLYRTLNAQSLTRPKVYTEARLGLQLGRFLSVHATPAECERMRQTLHALRTGALEPLPKQSGDENVQPPEWERWREEPDPFAGRGE